MYALYDSTVFARVQYGAGACAVRCSIYLAFLRNSDQRYCGNIFTLNKCYVELYQIVVFFCTLHTKHAVLNNC